MLILCLPVTSMAHTATKQIASFETAADLNYWKAGKWGSTALSDENKSTETKYLRSGNYSATITNMYNKNVWMMYKKSVAIDGYAYAYAWVYYEDSAYESLAATPTLQINTQTTYSGTSEYPTKTLQPGWNLVEWSISSKYRSATLEQIGFYIKTPTTAHQTVTLHIASLFFADTQITDISITSSSIKNEATLVKHNVGKMTLSGVGFAPRLLEGGELVIEPDVSNHIECVGNDLVIVFDENLQYGTDYTVSLTGAMDKNGIPYKTFISTFRTRGENENIPPEITLTAPEDGTRFITGESITLSADAFDEMGTISYVEFYANNELIEGSRLTEGVDGEYSFVWTPDIDNLEPVEISALACDNQGAEVMSDKVSIKVASLRSPTVEITSPEDGSIYYRNLAGIISDTSINIDFTAEDEDNAITSIEIYVDDELVKQETENLSITSYKLSEPLEAGEHTIDLVAYDETGLSSIDSIDVAVKTGGKRFPAVMNEDLTDSSMFARWDKTGDSQIFYGSLQKTPSISGIIISSQNPVVAEESKITRSYISALNIDPWQIDISLAFGDVLSSRTVKIGTFEVMTFEEGGNVTCGGEVVGKYAPGSMYTVSAVVNPVDGKMSCIFDGEIVKQNLTAAASNFTRGTVISISQIGAKGVLSETAVTHAEIYKMTDAVQNVSVTLYDKEDVAVEQIDAIPVDNSYIVVNMDDGVDTSTFAGNVKVRDLSTGEVIGLTYKDGKLAFNKQLKSDTSYRIIVGSSVRNTKGRAYSGAYTLDFTTGMKDFGVANSNVKFTSSDGTLIPGLPSTPCEIKLDIPFVNKSDSDKPVEIVCIAYEGNVAKQIVTLPINVTANTDSPVSQIVTMNLAEKFTEFTQNTVIEAFVVNNMDDLIPVSESIFILK